MSKVHHIKDNPWYAWKGPRPLLPERVRVSKRQRRKGSNIWALWYDGMGAHFTLRIDGIIQWVMV